MGIDTPTGASLTLLENLINTATEFIENYTGRRFKKATYTQEEYDTERAETLNLRNYPVVSGTTLTLEKRTSPLNEDDWEVVNSEYYHIDYNNGMLEGAGGMRFSRTRRGYRVTYTAGYDFDNSSTFLSDTEAGDVELATWMLVSILWGKTSAGVVSGGGEIKSERIGDYAVTYGSVVMANEDIKSILDKYGGASGSGGGGDGIGVIAPLTPIQA
jgi:hypothetical protein